MRIKTWSIGLATGMIFLLTGPVSLFVQESPGENVTPTVHQTPEEVRPLIFSPLSLGQKILLAAASVFHPEAAENALIRYFYPTSELSSRQNDFAMVGIRLDDGRYLVINPSSLSSLALEEQEDADHQVNIQLEDGWSLIFEPSPQSETASDEGEADTHQVRVQLEDGWSLIFEPSPQSETDPLTGQVLPRPNSGTNEKPQAIIHWEIASVGGETSAE